MKIIQEDRAITITDYNLVLDDGSVFPMDAWDLLELLDELKECDGLFTAITMNDEVGKELEKLDVARSNIRHGYYRGDNLDKFYKEINEALYGKPA